MLEVVDAGLGLTVQDRGRSGLRHLGVPPSGAADPWGLAVANLLAAAPPDAAALEVTLAGAELVAVETCAVAIAGADLGAERDDGRRLASGAVHVLPAGSRLRFGGSARGMRACLGFAGGLVAPPPLQRRPLRAGERLEPVRRGDIEAAGRTWPEVLAPHPATRRGPIDVIPGPDLGHLPPGAAELLATTAWHAGAASDRMGIRLEGASMPPGREILSHPIVPGSIQVPADGRPIVLLVDGPTIGGYPVVGVVPRADLPRLGQVRPGDPVAFRLGEVAAARVAWLEQQRRFAAAADAIRIDDPWHRLAERAGG